MKYDFVLVPNCTKHFINVLNRSERGKNYVALRHINCQLDLH